MFAICSLSGNLLLLQAVTRLFVFSQYRYWLVVLAVLEYRSTLNSHTHLHDNCSGFVAWQRYSDNTCDSKRIYTKRFKRPGYYLSFLQHVFFRQLHYTYIFCFRNCPPQQDKACSGWDSLWTITNTSLSVSYSSSMCDSNISLYVSIEGEIR